LTASKILDFRGGDDSQYWLLVCDRRIFRKVGANIS